MRDRLYVAAPRLKTREPDGNPSADALGDTYVAAPRPYVAKM
jgi:hypothetical protein